MTEDDVYHLQCQEVTEDCRQLLSLRRNPEEILNEEVSSMSQLTAILHSIDPKLDSPLDVLELMATTEKDFFVTLNAIRCLALEANQLLPSGVAPLLQQQRSIVWLSQRQIASLLSLAFFCLFAEEEAEEEEEEKSLFPGINFDKLFVGFKANHLTLKSEKLKCLFNYFRRRRIRREDEEEGDGVLSFERRVLDAQHVLWAESTRRVTRVEAREGLIQEGGSDGLAEVDFANKNVGGGVLRAGAVQEEIKFLECPELIVSRLFTERLCENEALIITGSEKYNECKGYAKSFQWSGDYVDERARDACGRRLSQLVVIDALNYNSDKWKGRQFEKEVVARELNKALTGFRHDKCALASGKWGCGAFGGDPHLKIVIQVMAASESEREIVFYCFDDKLLVNEIQELVQQLKAIEIKVLFGLMNEWLEKKKTICEAMSKKKRQRRRRKRKGLVEESDVGNVFQYIMDNL